MELFGGKIVTAKELEARITADCKGRKGLEDVPLMLTIPKHHTSNKSALLFEGDTVLGEDGSWHVHTDENWIKKNKISLIAVFGDLRISGDLINDDDKYFPVIYVGGALHVCNIAKGGAPLLVRGDLNATGYILGEYNDGPLRVGGTLHALGYIPQAQDKGGIKAHLIAGEINAPMFDARKDFTREELLSSVIEDVLTYKWFDTYSLFAKGRAGESVWHDETTRPVFAPAEPPPPVPDLQHADITSQGALTTPAEIGPQLEEMVKQKIPHNPDTYSYPESFAEYIRIHLRDNAKSKILVLPDGATIRGDIELDWSARWSNNGTISAIVCLGDLTVDGTIRNRLLEGGPMLFVGGNLKAHNVLKGGASVIVLGDVVVDGLMVGEYNDGVTRIAGDLHCEYFILLDHDGQVNGTVHGQRLCDDDDELRAVLVPSVFVDEDEYSPDVDLLWAHWAAKRPILAASD